MFCWGNATYHELCIEGPETLDLVSIFVMPNNYFDVQVGLDKTEGGLLLDIIDKSRFQLIHNATKVNFTKFN